MKRRYVAIALSLFAASCAANEDSNSNTTNPAAEKPALAPAPAIDAAPVATAKLAVPSIASVQLIQDCPDPKSAAKADQKSEAAPMGKMKAKRVAGSGPLHQPCTQSTLQMAFAGQGPASATVTLGEIRLRSADGKVLATLAHRMPSVWKESGYEAWDGTLAPNSDTKASYKLSLPDWAVVEKTLGGSSYGQMFSVEIDVDVSGTITKVQSPQFERGRPQIIKT